MAPKSKKKSADADKKSAEKIAKSAKKKASKKAEKIAAETPAAPAETVTAAPAETAESVPAAAETPKPDKKAAKKAKKAEKKAKAEKTVKAEKAPAEEKTEKAPKAEKPKKADKKSGKSEKKAKKAKKAEKAPADVPAEAPAPESVPAEETPAEAPSPEKSAAEAVPAEPKKAREPRKPKTEKSADAVPAETAPESVPAEEAPAETPSPEKSAEAVPAETVPEKPKKTRKPRKPKSGTGKNGAKPEITVERDKDVDKPARADVPAPRGAGRKLIFCAPSEVLKIFKKRGTKNFNLFEPEEAAAEPVPAPAVRNGNRILKELPKAAPRKIGAVSLDELFGYNPFAKDSVSAEEKLIPKKWLRFYKKLVALKASIQSEINEHSQTAFNRDGHDTTGDVSASYSQHTADIDNEAFTRDAALSLLSSKQQELAEINIAIERMKNGTYGICEITGKPIPVERLRDIPFTRYSIEGKLEAEKQRKAAVRRRRANTTTDIAAVTDIENDVPIVFSEDDDADAKKNAGNTEPETEEPTEK